MEDSANPTLQIHKTTDYDQFTLLGANRDIDMKHVKRLKHLMTENGNLTGDFPILVNAQMEVIDGQHRLTALKQLEWPVFYQIRENMNLEQVRAINLGHKNWSWLDFANSYAKLGNQNYERFLRLSTHFPMGYHVLTRYAGLSQVDNSPGRGKQSVLFRQGELEFTPERYSIAYERLKKWRQVSEFIEGPNQVMAQAFLQVLLAPGYDHTRMLEKMKKFGGPILERTGRRLNDYLRSFEEVFNMYQSEETRLRLY